MSREERRREGGRGREVDDKRKGVVNHCQRHGMRGGRQKENKCS